MGERPVVTIATLSSQVEDCRQTVGADRLCIEANEMVDAQMVDVGMEVFAWQTVVSQGIVCGKSLFGVGEGSGFWARLSATAL